MRRLNCYVVVVCVLGLSATNALGTVAGNALHFDGNDSVKLFDNADFRNLPYVTIEFWAKYDSPDNQGYIIDQLGPAPAYTGEWGVITRSEKIVFYYRWPGITEVPSNSSVTDGAWHHVAMAKHGGDFDLYIDGQPDLHRDLGSSHILNSDVPFYFGSRGNFEQFFEGDLDEIRIWDYKRSPEQISANWNTTVDPASSGLRGYWRFDEEFADQYVLDSCPRANHGSLGETLSPSGDDPTRVVSTAPIVPEPGTLGLVAVGLLLLRRKS